MLSLVFGKKNRTEDLIRCTQESNISMSIWGMQAALLTSAVWATAASSTACLFKYTHTVRLLQFRIDRPFGFSFRTPNRVSGATTYRVVISHILITYLKACQEAGAGFGQSAFGGPNLLNHRTHKSTTLFINGSAAKHFQQTIRRLWHNGRLDTLFGMDGSPSLARGRLPESGTIGGSGTVSD